MSETGFAVLVDDSGVARIGRSEQTRLAWQQITSVYAYKKDVITFDDIRIVLGDEVLRTWIEISEDDEGFKELITQLPSRLPGCLSEKEWWQKVALPPFATNWTQLFQRSVES